MSGKCGTCREWDYRGVVCTFDDEGRVKPWLHVGACRQSENVTQVPIGEWAVLFPAGSSCEHWAESDEPEPMPDEPMVCASCGEPYWPPAEAHEDCVEDAPMRVDVARVQAMGAIDRD